jgi:hypothetical protein
VDCELSKTVFASSISLNEKQVNRLNIAEQLLDWGVDGIITDYPTQVRRMVEQRGGDVFPAFSKSLVMSCLKKHVETV